MLPPSLLTLTVALFSFPQLSSPREDDRYRACSTPYPFNCGSISNVTYPFLAGDRRSFCGHPELKLTCDNNMPAIKIGSEKYQVKKLSYPDRLLTLVDTNILEDGCPTKSTYQSIGDHLLQLTERNEPLILSTGCSRAPTSGYFTVHQVSCPKVDKETNSSYWVFGWYPGMENWLPKPECSDTIEVSLLGVAVDRLNDDPSSFREVIKEGFEVRWKVEDAWCPDCEASGGVCGYNQSSPGDPACFCPDGSQSPSYSSPGRTTSLSPTILTIPSLHICLPKKHDSSFSAHRVGRNI